MPKNKNIEPTAEEVTRALLLSTVQKLPDSISQLIVNDPKFQKKVGLPDGDFVRVFDKRVERGHLLETLIAIADGAQPTLVAHDQSKISDNVEFGPDGSALITSGNAIARFSNVGLLAKSKPIRQKCLKELFADGKFTPKREAYWRRRINLRPLDGTGYLDLETELTSLPETVLSEISDQIVGNEATIDNLVQCSSEYLLDLVGLEKWPDSIEQFSRAWLSSVAKLKGKHLVRRIKLAAPISVLGGSLIGKATLNLSQNQRSKLLAFLCNSAEPLSKLAGLQIACASHSDDNALDAASGVLSDLWDAESNTYLQAAADTQAIYTMATALWTKDRKLESWPLYAQRLVKFVHASHIARVLDQHDVERKELHKRILGAFQYSARLSEYVDLQSEPYWQAIYFQPSTIVVHVFRQSLEIVNAVQEKMRPPEWEDKGAKMLQNLSEQQTGLLLLAASPFSGFSEKWSGLNELNSEHADDMLALLDKPEAVSEWLDRLLKLQLSFELPNSKRDAFRSRLLEIINELFGEQFVQVVEIGLHIAVRWKDTALADDIINIMFRRFRDSEVEDNYMLIRQILLASASESSEEKWLEKLETLAQAFAAIYPAGARIDKYRDSLKIIAEMSESLALAVAPALSVAALVDNQVVA